MTATLTKTIVLFAALLSTGRAADPQAESLTREVLAAYQAGDADKLAALRITGEEYRDIVWPALPVNKPGNNISLGFVYGRHDQNSRGAMTSALKFLKGRKFEFVSVKFGPERDKYRGFRILADPEIRLKDEKGEIVTFRLYGAIWIHNGRYKVFNYYGD